MRLAIRAWGEEGRPLAVLVHGVTASSGTWWRVGPWFAKRGWRAVAVDLRGHGDSPRMVGGEGLEYLAADLHGTVLELLNPGERVEALIGHSLGALTSLKLAAEHPDLVRRLVLEDPPDSNGGPSGFEEIAHDVEAGVARSREDFDAVLRTLRAENPAWADRDVANDVAGDRACDAVPVAALVRDGLRLDLPAMVGALEVPTLLMLGDEDEGSVMLEPERSAVAEALKHGKVEVFETGHCIHRDDFEGYVGLLGRWLDADA